MDPLRQEAIDAERDRSAAAKLLEALQVMRDGIELKRASLKLRYPSESDDQIDARLDAWMLND